MNSFGQLGPELLLILWAIANSAESNSVPWIYLLSLYVELCHTGNSPDRSAFDDLFQVPAVFLLHMPVWDSLATCLPVYHGLSVQSCSHTQLLPTSFATIPAIELLS